MCLYSAFNPRNYTKMLFTKQCSDRITHFFKNAGVLKILTLVRDSSNRPLMKQQSHHVRILPTLGNIDKKDITMRHK